MILNIKRMFNILIAFLITPFYRRKISKEKIILIGGHEGKVFVDNGKAFYDYMQKEWGHKYNIFWVINNDSRDRSLIKNYIIRGSVKNYIYYFFSIGLFYSHSASDVAPIIHNYIKTKSKRILLGHGVDGYKKIKLPEYSKQEINERADLFISVSEFEKKIKVEQWGIDEKAVRITGIPRYDGLIRNKEHEKNIILYMPTWREWYKDLSPEEFKETDYYKNIMNIMENKELLKLMKRYNYKFQLYVHFYFHQFVDTFKIDKSLISVLSPNINVQELLLNSKILITDYSSVCWDFFYLEKPVIFFQFDQTVYEEKRGSYLDLNKELIGEKVQNIDELLLEIEKSITNSEMVHNKFKHLKNKYFKYQDTYNCERIYYEFKNM